MGSISLSLVRGGGCASGHPSQDGHLCGPVMWLAGLTRPPHRISLTSWAQLWQRGSPQEGQLEVVQRAQVAHGMVPKASMKYDGDIGQEAWSKSLLGRP